MSGRQRNISSGRGRGDYLLDNSKTYEMTQSLGTMNVELYSTPSARRNRSKYSTCCMPPSGLASFPDGFPDGLCERARF